MYILDKILYRNVLRRWKDGDFEEEDKMIDWDKHPFLVNFFIDYPQYVGLSSEKEANKEIVYRYKKLKKFLRKGVLDKEEQWMLEDQPLGG